MRTQSFDSPDFNNAENIISEVHYKSINMIKSLITTSLTSDNANAFDLFVEDFAILEQLHNREIDFQISNLKKNDLKMTEINGTNETKGITRADYFQSIWTRLNELCEKYKSVMKVVDDSSLDEELVNETVGSQILHFGFSLYRIKLQIQLLESPEEKSKDT